MTRIIIILCCFAVAGSIHAQTIDPSNWQENTSGLSIQNNAQKRTAGLGFIVTVGDYPILSFKGGVRGGGYQQHYIIDAGSTSLGAITIPAGAAMTLMSEDTTWDHNALHFTQGSNSLHLISSRIVPATLIETDAVSLSLFSGDISRYVFDGANITAQTAGPASFRYGAYIDTNDDLKVLSLNSTAVNLADMKSTWMLVWYGSNSPFVDSTVPRTYMAAAGGSQGTYKATILAYQADKPVVLKFEMPPTTIAQSTSGGITVSFASAAGNIALMPITGKATLRATDTEQWASNPSASAFQSLITTAQTWDRALCNFPVSVSETYDSSSTTMAVIRETFTYKTLCTGQNPVAFLPPSLAISKDYLPIVFRANGTTVTPQVLGINTEFGPIMGIADANEYTWEYAGIDKYLFSKRIFPQALPLSEAPIQSELTTQLQTFTGGGIAAPWKFSDHGAVKDFVGDIYWINPADTVKDLVQIAEVLPQVEQQAVLSYIDTNYISTSNTAYRPDVSIEVPLAQGTPRVGYSHNTAEAIQYWYNRRDGSGLGSEYPTNVFLHKLTLANIYGMAKFYELSGSTPSSTIWSNTLDILDSDMQDQDWATMYWFDSAQDTPVAVVNANRFFAGTVGLAKLAQLQTDVTMQNLASAIFAKAAVQRMYILEYANYLYVHGLITLPSDPAWQAKNTYKTSYNSIGYLFNYSWTSPADDAREVLTLNQFGVKLMDHSGFGGWTDFIEPYLIAYRAISPELGRFLQDYDKNTALIYKNKVQLLIPDWYAALSEGVLGLEHNLNHPIDSYQLFLAEAYISQTPADQLKQYIDIPWLENGDLFYMNKLAETIKAYRGVCWSTDGTTCDDGTAVSPTPPPAVPGDTDDDGDVDIFDYNAVITDFGKTGGKGFSVADFDGDNDVDIFDYNVVISNFGS